MILTLPQLTAIMPLAGDRAPIFLDCLNTAMHEFDCDTLGRQAAFLAQIAHESYQLKYTREIWGPTDAQRDYEFRRDLGNTHVGDGQRFAGRGLIQVTGRTNTLACLAALGRKDDDLSYLETPMGASRSAAWFFKVHDLLPICDAGNFGTLTKKINGGYNGLDERIKFYVKARKVLGI